MEVETECEKNLYSTALRANHSSTKVSPGIGVTREPREPFPLKNSSISCRFVLWKAVSQAKYCFSLKIKTFGPRNLGWLRYCPRASNISLKCSKLSYHCAKQTALAGEFQIHYFCFPNFLQKLVSLFLFSKSLVSIFAWYGWSGPALADAGPNARPGHGAPLSSDFMTSSCSVNRVTIVVERRYAVQH